MKRKTTILYAGSGGSKTEIFSGFRHAFTDHTFKMPHTFDAPSVLKDINTRRKLDGIIFDLDSTHSHLTADPLLFISDVRDLMPTTTIFVLSQRFDSVRNSNAEQEQNRWLNFAEVDCTAPRKGANHHHESLALRFRHAIDRYGCITIGNLTFLDYRWTNPNISENAPGAWKYIQYGTEKYRMPRKLFETLLTVATLCQHRAIPVSELAPRIDGLSTRSLQKRLSQISKFFRSNGLPKPFTSQIGRGILFSPLPPPNISLLEPALEMRG